MDWMMGIPPAHRGLKIDLDAGKPGRGNDLVPALGQEGLVRGNHMLPGLDGLEDIQLGRHDPTDELHHQVDRGILNDLHGVVGKDVLRQFDVARARQVLLGYPGQLQLRADMALKLVLGTRKDLGNAGADGPQAQEPDPYHGFYRHDFRRPAAKRAPCPRGPAPSPASRGKRHRRISGGIHTRIRPRERRPPSPRPAGMSRAPGRTPVPR